MFFRGKVKLKSDLLEGPVFRTLLSFSLPILAGTIVSEFYNVADSVIVGQYVGVEALAAVSAASPVMNIINMFLIGLSTGSNVVIAQRAGQRDPEKLQKAIGAVAALTLTIAAIVTVLGLVFCRPLLDLMGTPVEIMDDAASYLVIIFLGTGGNLIYQMGSGALRGMGDSLMPFLFLTLCSVLNVVLDLIAVSIFGWDVWGVALATALAQIISGAGIVVRINRGGYGVRLTMKTIRFDSAETRRIIGIGLPAAIQNIGNAVANIFCQSFSNTFGSDFIAANGIITKLENFSYIPTTALSTAVCTFVGQNVAAGEYDRAHKSINTAIGFLFAVGTFLCGVMIVLRNILPYAFSQSDEVARIAAEGLMILAFITVFHGLDRVLVNAMRGAGKSIVPMITAQFSVFSRIPLCYFLAVKAGDYHGMFWAMLIASVLRTAAIGIYYYCGGWKKAIADYRKKAGLS